VIEIIIYHQHSMHTIDTIMSKLATFRIHIAPLGFEIDRIVLPLKETKADKLWLLIHEKTAEDKSGPYLESIKKQCKKLGVQLELARLRGYNWK